MSFAVNDTYVKGPCGARSISQEVGVKELFCPCCFINVSVPAKERNSRGLLERVGRGQIILFNGFRVDKSCEASAECLLLRKHVVFSCGFRRLSLIGREI